MEFPPNKMVGVGGGQNIYLYIFSKMLHQFTKKILNDYCPGN